MTDRLCDPCCPNAAVRCVVMLFAGAFLAYGVSLLSVAPATGQPAEEAGITTHVSDQGRTTTGGPVEAVSGPARRFTEQELQSRVVSWHTIGGTHRSIDLRMVGLHMKSLGWHGYVETHAAPQVRGGVRRILLHNPWGIVPGEPMSFDQYIEAREAGMLWLTRGFVEAWRPVVRGDYSDGEPVEVIAYFGAIDADQSLLELLAQPEGGSAAWLTRVSDALGPAMQAGMSIAFDSANNLPADSPEHRLIQLLNALGHRTYVEPRPILNAPHLHAGGVISTMHLWQRTDPDIYPVRHMAPNDVLTGDVIVLVRGLKPDERLAVTRQWLAEHPVSLAVPLRGQVSSRMPLSVWVNGPEQP